MTYEQMLAEAQSRGLSPAGVSSLSLTGEVVYGLGDADTGPSSPAAFYGDTGIGVNGHAGADGLGGAMPIPLAPAPGAVAAPAALGVFVLGASVIARFLGIGMVRRIALWMTQNGVRRGVQVAWARIPFWMRAILPALGASAGYDVIFDLDDSGEAVPAFPMIPGGQLPEGLPTGPGQQPGPGVVIIGGWVANGRRFYRLSDGKIATQKNSGKWTVWRPKRPIVMYATGAADLDVLLRADRAVDKQSSKLAKMLRRRGYAVAKKAVPKPC